MNSFDVKKRSVFILKTEHPLLFLTAIIRANGAVLFYKIIVEIIQDILPVTHPEANSC